MRSVIRPLIFSLSLTLLGSLSSLSEAAGVGIPLTFTNLIWTSTWVLSPTDQNWLRTCSGAPTLNMDLTMGTGSDNGMMYGLILCTGTTHLADGAAHITQESAFFDLHHEGAYRWSCQVPSLPTSLNGSCIIRNYNGQDIGTLNLTYQP